MKNIFYFLLLSSGLFFTACNVTNLEPISAISLKNYYKTPGDARGALFGTYNYLQGVVPLVIKTDYNADGLSPAPGLSSPYEDNTLTPTTGGIASLYGGIGGIYATLQRANQGLALAPGVTDVGFPDKPGILAEYRFIRALCLFYATQLWGNIPMPLMPLTEFEIDKLVLGQTNKEQVYLQIIADLEQAISDLPASYANNLETRGRATKAAAQSLLAKVLLTRGKNEDLTRVADLTAQVLANTQYQLVSTANYLTMFQPSGKNSTESIFELQYDQSRRHNLKDEFLPLGNGDNTGQYLWRPTAKLIQNYLLNDRRNAGIDTVDNKLIKSGGGNFNNDQLGRVFVTKYQREGTLEPNIIILRLADVILMRAEALSRSGQAAAAITELNKIRTRAFGSSAFNYPSATLADTDLSTAIENERFKELAFEGHRWFDLVRTNRAVSVLGIAANRTLWPFPQEEVQSNYLLVQNPGYN